jgi:3-phosphoglycerate kinase
VDNFRDYVEDEQHRLANYLIKEFKQKEFFLQETIDYLKMELKKRENALFENIRIRELETRLKEFSDDAMKAKALEERNKKYASNYL